MIPIGGYHKKFWILESIVVGMIGGGLSILGHRAGPLVLVFCYVAQHYEIAVTDLLVEGKYAELMRDNPHSGSDVITLVNGLQMAGTICAICIVGPLSDYGHYEPILYVTMALTIVPLVPTLVGWLPEKRRQVGELRLKKYNACCWIDWNIWRNNKQLIVLIASAGLGGPILASVTAFVPHVGRYIGMGLALSLLATCIFLAFRVCPTLVARVALYQVLTSVSKPSMGSALDFFFTDDCLVDGPGFSYTYYVTWTGILASVFSFASVFLYQIWMSNWRYRTVLIVTSMMSACGGIVDMIIVLRLNIRMGIPDKWFYVLGDAILESVVQMLFWIPSSSIISKVVSQNMEASLYAFLAGLSNLSRGVSEISGAVIFDMAGIKTDGDNCEFGPLWWLILCFHILLPLIVGVAAAFLIPNAKQTDELNPDGTYVDLDTIREVDEDDAVPFIDY